MTSEWDTQISKQLRAMDAAEDSHNLIIHSRIFSTGAGIRPAEPCSLSVVATHQLLTNLLQYICAFVLSDRRYRQCAGAVVTDQDLTILEKCNRSNIQAMSEIVSADEVGEPYEPDEVTITTKSLRSSGNLWADHILENVRSYIITFLYIFGTVISGYPLVFGIATGCGLDANSDFIYLSECRNGGDGCAC